MKDSFPLRFLYRTVPGRALLACLVRPSVSRAAGTLLSSPISKCAIPRFIKKNGISLEGIEVPEGGFPSFNAFFTRKRKSPGFEPAEGNLISPCDALLTYQPIRKDVLFEVKRSVYTLNDLLDDPELARSFEGGSALIFRLTPAHYHRYCYCADGEILASRSLKGVLHCVRPVALASVPVFVRNSREYRVIRTERFGLVVQMEVGALFVGKMANRRESIHEKVRAGEEKGYFEFGGSTIILLVQKDMVRFDPRQYTGRLVGGEIPIRMGEILGENPVSPEENS